MKERTRIYKQHQFGDYPQPTRERADTKGSGKIAVVTGASSGIGTATALRLASNGFTVYGVARRTDLLTKLQKSNIYSICCDLTEDEQRQECVTNILDKTGRIDVLVNNAGSGLFGALEDIPIEDAQKVFELNVFAPARLTQLFLPTFRAQGSGTIVNMSSIAGKIYSSFQAWYHASKSALEGLSDVLRVELQPYGIRVIVIEPGAIHTEGLQRVPEELQLHSGSGYYADRANASARSIADLESVSASEVANTISAAVSSRRPRPRYVVGKGAQSAIWTHKILPTWLFDQMMEMHLRQHMK